MGVQQRTDLRRSVNANQLLSFGTDGGLYLSCPTILSCINIASTSLEGTGAVGTPFAVKISPTAGNIITATATGLYAAAVVGATKRTTALEFVRNEKINTIRWLKLSDHNLQDSDVQPFRVPFAMTLKGISTSFGTFPGGTSVTLSIMKNAVLAASLVITTQTASDDVITVSFVAGDLISMSVIKTVGTDPNDPYVAAFITEV